MKYSICLFKSIAIICACISTSVTHAEAIDYLINFKIPVQQTFCISKSTNGDMSTYKQCMLAIEKGSYECDKITKASYDKMLIKYTEPYKGVTGFMNDMKPITMKHFDCLSRLY